VKKTTFGYCLRPPAHEHKDVAITLHCVTCGTLRSFLISVNLAAFEARTVSAFGVEASCPVCNQTVGFSLSWIDGKQPGYSYKPAVPMNSTRIEDGMSLQRPIEARQE